MLIDRGDVTTGQENALVNLVVDFIYINFTTTHSNGMILWTSRNDGHEYFGVGVEDGLLKVSPISFTN